MIRVLALAGGIATVSSQAIACNLSLMACSFDNGAKTVEVCLSFDQVTYAFGPAEGEPDLLLSEHVTTVDYLPWPGVGSAIWETVTFYNGDYSYAVTAGFERNPENPKSFGGISVRRGTEEVANLTCDPESVDFGWEVALFDAKRAAGMCWNDAPNRGWSSC